MNSQELVDKIVQLSLDKKGSDIAVLDLQGISDVADFFILVSGESDIHVKTISNYIEKNLKEANIKIWHKEGFNKLNWVLLDLVGIVVHIFRSETREYYALEKLWADAKLVKVEENAPTGILSDTAN